MPQFQNKKLTKAVCDRARYQGSGDRGFYAVWDNEIKEVGLRISREGKKSFILTYRIERRKPFITIGPYGAFTVEQTRKMAIDKLAPTHNGTDPPNEKINGRNESIIEKYKRSILSDEDFKKILLELTYINNEEEPEKANSLMENVNRFVLLYDHWKKIRTKKYGKQILGKYKNALRRTNGLLRVIRSFQNDKILFDEFIDAQETIPIQLRTFPFRGFIP